ncbi:HNH endonuclease [Streptacidiphilus albus]|uniref:HNH endonuclease n=1 Tax=Streptacidiphilus albus TaxID=105425 RepID=UPI00054B66E2|nr:HNH endonuclease [Streptacidiphilus albus]
MPKRFCLNPDCKVLFDATTGRSRCPACQAELDTRMNSRPKANTTDRGLGWQHQQRARESVSQDMACHICGGRATESDPMTADHQTPRAQGGGDSPLLPAHRSCNSRRGGRQRRRGR